MRTDYLTPCSPSAAGAIEMSWMDIEPDQLFEPYVSMQVILTKMPQSPIVTSTKQVHFLVDLCTFSFSNPPILIQDMERSLDRQKPSCNDDDLTKMSSFTKDFGQEG